MKYLICFIFVMDTWNEERNIVGCQICHSIRCKKIAMPSADQLILIFPGNTGKLLTSLQSNAATLKYNSLFLYEHSPVNTYGAKLKVWLLLRILHEYMNQFLLSCYSSESWHLSQYTLKLFNLASVLAHVQQFSRLLKKLEVWVSCEAVCDIFDQFYCLIF